MYSDRGFEYLRIPGTYMSWVNMIINVIQQQIAYFCSGRERRYISSADPNGSCLENGVEGKFIHASGRGDMSQYSWILHIPVGTCSRNVMSRCALSRYAFQTEKQQERNFIHVRVFSSLPEIIPTMQYRTKFLGNRETGTWRGRALLVHDFEPRSEYAAR